jgi:hypothetical protein
MEEGDVFSLKQKNVRGEMLSTLSETLEVGYEGGL